DDPKSEMIHFYRQRNFTATNHQIRLPNRTMVVPKACLRWLGVWLDSKLSFKEHVKTKVAAAQQSLALIRQLANTEKGLSAAGIRQLYQTCVVSVVDYGSEVWWKGQTHLANKLQLLQNSATRSILGAFRTSPTTVLDAEAGLLPANLHLNYNQTRLATRILKLPSTHPLVQRLPDSVPKNGAKVPEEVFASC